jgi:hypothetical protein
MATGIYEWKDKQPVPDFGSMVTATKDPASPAPMQSPSTPTAGGSMFGGGAVPSFGDMVKGGPAASSPTPSFNDLFSGMGDTRAQNLQGAQQAIGQGLSASGPSAGSQVARNSFIKAQEAAERKVLEQSALSGRDETGQIRGDRQDYLSKTALPQRMDFEAQLQAQEEQQAQARQQNAVGNLLAMEGLGEQGRGTDAQNALAARGQDITVRGQDIEERQANKSLAESARQFNSRQDFETWATEGGWDQDAIARAWQSGENSADRAVTVSEGALGRELERYLGEGRLDIDRQQLSETIRQFDGKLAFDQWATQAGLDDNAAARVWEGHLQDLQQKWSTGERLGSQDHQVLIEDKQIKAQTAAQEFERVANLEVLGKTQDWERAQAEILNGYQVARDQGQMSHEEALQAARGQIEASLTQMGIGADAARQAAELKSREWLAGLELEQQKTLANADLLFKYDSLRTQAGIDQQSLDLRKTEVLNQVTQFAQTFGLDKAKTDALLKSEDWERHAILMELSGDNPDMVGFASHQFVDLLANQFGISAEEKAAMHAAIDAKPPAPVAPPPPTGPSPGAPAGNTTTTAGGRVIR